ncbi:DNA methyltransferase [Sphingomonas abietis]|uniref:site-specific DNA-methyltransferase (adenine-specific) n=1 Tax=Sphingomonas abietis TaxID=3012344 RepID=A0ABY7NJD8_9SPHN|nr:DNA methyltransferase [Sphingomonas abietis]WBO21608.1 DNA methyltransferase [Sphingomonas abietis]
MNRLHYGDNLDVLRAHVADASVDLVYLDPPFNSNASYNILFKSQSGAGTDASIEAFDDSWQWGPAAANALIEITQSGHHKLHMLMQAMRSAIGENALMAYLAMMAVRLVELHRVLKPTGSLYLHCDPTASHYLKLVLDAVFGAENFRNEIVWRRTNAHNKLSRQFGPIHDIIFFYSVSDRMIFHPGRRPFTKSYVKDSFPHEDARGPYQSNVLTGAGSRKGDSGQPWRGYDPNAKNRHWALPGKLLAELAGERGAASPQHLLDRLDALGLILHPARSGSLPRYKQYLEAGDGVLHQDIWAYQPGTRGILVGTPDGIDQDVKWLDNTDEKLGYPTQKPLALLERIIAASSNPGDVVLDPFCGCGTAVDAAQKLGRQWIGIDVTHLAVGLIEKRLREGYGEAVRFETIGVPKDRDSALRLAGEKPHEFQNWFCLKVGGYPLDGGRKGADRGVDGHFYPYESGGTTSTGVISVKAGQHVGVAMVRDLRGVMERDAYPFGLFLSAYEPTRPMLAEAMAAGLHDTQLGRFPRLQILTPADIFHGGGAKLPPLAPVNRRAVRVETRPSHQFGSQAQLL